MTTKIDMNPVLQSADAVNGFVRSTDQPNRTKVEKVEQLTKSSSNGSLVDKVSGDKVVDRLGTGKTEETDKSNALNKKAELNKEELNKVVTDLNSSIQNVQRNLAFSVDDNSGQIVINVTDKESGDVVRQIPSEDVLKLAGKLQEMVDSRRENNSATTDGFFVKTSA